MKVINYVNKIPKMRCWVIAEHFSIGKTCTSKISRNAKTLFEGYSIQAKMLREKDYLSA